MSRAHLVWLPLTTASEAESGSTDAGLRDLLRGAVKEDNQNNNKIRHAAASSALLGPENPNGLTLIEIITCLDLSLV